jgi:hypothetical protein
MKAEQFKVSALDIINQSGMFTLAGEENGVPVYVLKKETDEDQIDEDDCYLESTC